MAELLSQYSALLSKKEEKEKDRNDNLNRMKSMQPNFDEIKTQLRAIEAQLGMFAETKLFLT